MLKPLLLVGLFLAAFVCARKGEILLQDGAVTQHIIEGGASLPFAIETVERVDVEYIWTLLDVDMHFSHNEYAVYVSDHANETTISTRVYCHWPHVTDEEVLSNCTVSLSKFGVSSLVHDISNEFAERPAHYYLIVKNTGADPLLVTINAEENIYQRYGKLLVFGLLLYTQAGWLSSSLLLYHVLWFSIGSIFSLLVIAVIAFTIVGRQLKFSFMNLITGAAALGYLWVMRVVVDSFSSYWDLFTSKITLTVLISGGVFGLYYGYRSSLDKEQVQATRLVLKILALSFVFHSTPLTEYSLSFTLAIVIVDLLRWKLFWPIFALLRLLGLSSLAYSIMIFFDDCLWTVRSFLGLLPARRMLSEEEYEQQGRQCTADHLADLRTYYRDHPEELMKFEGPRLAQMLAFTRNDPSQYCSDSALAGAGAARPASTPNTAADYAFSGNRPPASQSPYAAYHAFQNNDANY